MIRIAILICSAYLCGAVDYPKIWIVNINATDVQFWNSMVTVGDVTFNYSMKGALAIPKTVNETEGCELVFPLDNQLTTAGTEDINFADDQCYDKESLERMEHIYWLDPRNWRSSGFTIATPHVEMVPCDYGNVQIPNTTNTFIILPPKPVTLRLLRFGYRYIGNRELKSLSQSEYFAKHFIVKYAWSLQEMFNLSSTACSDRTGCVCGWAMYEDEICAFVKRNCTPSAELPCTAPITPIGHCCPICGSTVLVVFNQERFVYKKLSAVVTKYIASENTELELNIVMHMSKVMDQVVQIVLVPEDEYTEELEDMANGLKVFLKSRSNLAVEECLVDVSGRRRGQGWLTVGKIFVVLISVLIGGTMFVYASKLKFFGDVVKMFSVCKLQSKNEDVKYGLNKVDKNVTHKSDDEETTTQAAQVARSQSTEAVNLIDSFS